MRFEGEEGLPVGVGDGVGFLEEEELQDHAGGVGEDFGVEAGEDSAFVFVVVGPGCGLAGLGDGKSGV